MAVPFRLSDAADVWDERIKKIWFREATRDPEKYKDYICTDTTDLADFRDSGFSGLGRAQQLAENASVVYDTPFQGFDLSYIQREFALGFSVTKRLWKFDKKNIIKKLPSKLMRSLIKKREVDCANYLNNHTATTYRDREGNLVTISGGDGLALASASHTREDGGTAQNNIIGDGTTVNMDFAEDGVEALERTASLALDARGEPMEFAVDRIIVRRGSPISFAAERLLRSSCRVETADNDTNIFKGKYKLVELDYLTAANQAFWFGMDYQYCMDNNSGIWLYWSQPPEMEGPKEVFDTGAFKYKGTQMYDLRHNDWRGMFTSTGANA